jgi:hypothetical protein
MKETSIKSVAVKEEGRANGKLPTETEDRNQRPRDRAEEIMNRNLITWSDRQFFLPGG